MSSGWQAEAQLALYGKQYLTRRGFVRCHQQESEHLSPCSLDGKCVLIAGVSTQGVGFEIACFAASMGADVFIVTTPQLGSQVTSSLSQLSGSQRIFALEGDLSICDEVARIVHQFCQASHTLDRLVCCTLDKHAPLSKVLTREGHETVFATHLLVGRYLLTNLLLPFLRAAENARVVFLVSSEFYLTKFPALEVAASEGKQPYSARRNMAYAQRGTVLLAERLAHEERTITFVCANPGYVAGGPTLHTSAPEHDLKPPPSSSVQAPPAIDAADDHELRTAQQGADGTCWLLVAPAAQGQKPQVVSGRVYLDGRLQSAHIAGAFFSQGWATKNSSAEVSEMMAGLQRRAPPRWFASATALPVAALPLSEQCTDSSAAALGSSAQPAATALLNPRGSRDGAGPALGTGVRAQLWLRRRLDAFLCCT